MNFTKLILIVLIMIAGVSGVVYYANYTLPPEYGKYVEVRITLEGNENYVNITSVEAIMHTALKGKVPGEAGYTPSSINVNMVYRSNMVGLWTSTTYHGTGSYNLSIGLRSQEPKPGDRAVIVIEVMDRNSNKITSGYSPVVLKSENESEFRPALSNK